jgi:hypothetical protein
VIKQLKPEADHLLPFSVEVMNEWSYTSTSPVCLNGLCRETLLFYHYQRRAASSSVSEISNTYHHENFSVGALRRLHGKLPAGVYSVGKTETKRNRLAPRIAHSETFIQI